MYCGEECNACTVGPLRRSCLTACGALSASRSDSIGLVSLFDTERPRPTKSASRSCPSFHDHTVNLFTSCLIRYLGRVWQPPSTRPARSREKERGGGSMFIFQRILVVACNGFEHLSVLSKQMPMRGQCQKRCGHRHEMNSFGDFRCFFPSG